MHVVLGEARVGRLVEKLTNITMKNNRKYAKRNAASDDPLQRFLVAALSA